MSETIYSLGLDFGTNSVRTLILNLVTGEETASAEARYPSGEEGILTVVSDHHLARQNPGDYKDSLEKVVPEVIEKAKEDKKFKAERIVGIGVDTTGSSPLPVDENCVPLAFQKQFKSNLEAQLWLWKDHTSAEEAQKITELAGEHRPQYLKKYGGSYSSEWFFSKIWHCLNTDPEVFYAAHTWLEFADYIPALLAGIKDPKEIKRSVCSAGHKGMYNESWGGLPDKDFLSLLHPDMGALRNRLFNKAYTSDIPAGNLSPEWSKRLGLFPGIPVSVGALDAHLGAVGSGAKEGVLVKIIGTSTCDIMVSPGKKGFHDIPGVSGIVDGSVVPGYFGIEAGQSAVGDIFNWFVSQVCRHDSGYHKELSEKASQLRPGQSGLLALDWNNGNRSILVDPKLTGLIVGQTIHTTQEEIYRALIEATAFGALVIIKRMEEYGVKIEKVINCGGIAEKNPLAMQIYADVLGRPMEISSSSQTCALGASIMGAVAAGEKKSGFKTTEEVQAKVCRVKEEKYIPREKKHKVYQKLFKLYCRLHDSFGVQGSKDDLYPVMKELLKIKNTYL
jgi:L-ribulokinase